MSKNAKDDSALLAHSRAAVAVPIRSCRVASGVVFASLVCMDHRVVVRFCGVQPDDELCLVARKWSAEIASGLLPLRGLEFRVLLSGRAEDPKGKVTVRVELEHGLERFLTSETRVDALEALHNSFRALANTLRAEGSPTSWESSA